MMIYSKKELANSLLDDDIELEVITSGRQRCGREWIVGPRVIPQHLMYYVSGGTVICQMKTGQIALPSETFFWLQPGEQHRFQLHSESQPAEVVFFRFLLALNANPVRLKEPSLGASQEPWLRDALLSLLPNHLPAGTLRTPAIRYSLGSLLCRILSLETGPDVRQHGLSRHHKEQALQFIRRHMANPFPIANLALALSFNPDYFSRQFKKTFGVPPQEWIKRERIHQAATHLLETSTPIKLIALSLGYDDLYFFSRQFKSVTGKSPRHYRAIHTQ
jgi:AraC-like DNA-binding protein